MTPSEEKDVREGLNRIVEGGSHLAEEDQVNMPIGVLRALLQAAEQEVERQAETCRYANERINAAEQERDKLAEEVERLKADAWGPAIVRSSVALRERAEAAEAKLAIVQNFHAHPGQCEADRSSVADDAPSYRQGWHDAIHALLTAVNAPLLAPFTTLPKEPCRIQLSRAKGWRMPPNTVKVDRSTDLGNPFPADISGAADAVDRYRRWMTGNMSAHEMSGLSRQDRTWQCSLVTVRRIARDRLAGLRGKNLACWCKLCPEHKDGKPFGLRCEACAPCHSDLLGELANPPSSSGKPG